MFLLLYEYILENQDYSDIILLGIIGKCLSIRLSDRVKSMAQDLNDSKIIENMLVFVVYRHRVGREVIGSDFANF